MSVTTKEFGVTKEGEKVTLYTIENSHGMRADVIDYGANLVRLFVPDKNGSLDDVVLGFDSIESYEGNGCFFGSTIGRHGNRIGNATFTLNGETYELEKNDGENNLHGGTPGYNKVMYQAVTTENSVTFARVSPDLEQGYPGDMTYSVTYHLTEDNELRLHYYAKSNKDTLCNMTNHSYFNLKGHDGGEITDHEVWIKADGVTETSEDLIPNGNIIDVEGTPLDFTMKKKISRDIEEDYKPLLDAGGYDHNFVLDIDGSEVEKVAELSEETTGRVMEVFTDLPGMQLYTGNFIEKEDGKEGATYTKRSGVCFETQFFPNSINIDSFKPCILKAGEPFESTTIYRFSGEEE